MHFIKLFIVASTTFSVSYALPILLSNPNTRFDAEKENVGLFGRQSDGVQEDPKDLLLDITSKWGPNRTVKLVQPAKLLPDSWDRVPGPLPARTRSESPPTRPQNTQSSAAQPSGPQGPLKHTGKWDVSLIKPKDDNRYHCDVSGCTKSYATLSGLRNHVREAAVKGKEISGTKCDFPGCGKEIARKSNLATHMKTHSKEKTTQKAKKS